MSSPFNLTPVVNRNTEVKWRLFRYQNSRSSYDGMVVAVPETVMVRPSYSCCTPVCTYRNGKIHATNLAADTLDTKALRSLSEKNFMAEVISYGDATWFVGLSPLTRDQAIKIMTEKQVIA